MNTFRSLEWLSHDDNLEGLYAAPDSLKWRYSIIKHKDEKFEFAVLDHNLEYASGFPKFYQSIDTAKDEAWKHYFSIVNQLVLS